MRLAPHALPLAAGLVIACGGQKASAPVIRLGSAGDTVASAYGEVSQGVWLGGDRWAVLAPADQVVGVVDFASRKVEPLGGTRGKELRNPSVLFRAGDTLYVGDWGLRRTSLWTLDGRFVRSVPAADALRGVLARARDGAARFYFEVPQRPGPEGQGNRDSAAVVRTGPGLEAPDTLVRLAPLDIAQVQSDAGRRFERRIFSGTDWWGVLPDGSVWVARVNDNRVDWRDPKSEWTRGRPLPDRVLEVTRYDRELFLRRFPPELRSTAEQLPFAPIKPPFEVGFGAPSGEVWLEKSRAPADSARRYHVVDRQGHLIREIQLFGRGRILAVAGDAVLAAEPSRDGARMLRLALPAVTAAQ
jgi:hypothetical protein